MFTSTSSRSGEQNQEHQHQQLEAATGIYDDDNDDSSQEEEEEEEEEEDADADDSTTATAAPSVTAGIASISVRGDHQDIFSSTSTSGAADLDEDEDGVCVYAWGQNNYNELMLGDNRERPTPTPVVAAKGKKIVAACAGNEHTALLSADGRVFVCGYNDSGQLGVGTTERVSQLTHLEALDGKGITLLSSANGCEHLCAVSRDGKIYTCGYSARGQTGHGVSTQYVLTPRVIASLSAHRVTKVACSYYHTLVSTDADLVFGFGRGDHGQLSLGTTTDCLTPTKIEALSGRGVVSLACGQYHSIIATRDDGVLTCGKNDFYQCGIQSSAPRLMADKVASPLTDLPVVAVSAGYYHSCALTATGQIFSWGRNDFGQLGVGGRENAWRPQEIKGLLSKKMIQIASGCYHNVALDDEGIAYCWGRNNHYSLGRKHADSPRPLRVVGLQNRFVTEIAAGFYHSIAITVSRRAAHERGGAGGVGGKGGLAADLRRLVDSDRLSDVKFIVEGEVIRAHRCILVARCEPLARMLEGGMKEGTGGGNGGGGELEIPIPEVGHKVFLAFLEFCYSDDVLSLSSPPPIPTGGGGNEGQMAHLAFAMDLLTLADQYLLDRLKHKCEQAILRGITASNVAEVLATADARNACDLRRRCLEYMLSNFARVIATEAFSQLPTGLLHEVLVEASKRGVQIGGGGVGGYGGQGHVQGGGEGEGLR